MYLLSIKALLTGPKATGSFLIPPPKPSPPLAPSVEVTHNPVYGGIPPPPVYMEHTDLLGGNRDVMVNMDIRYQVAPGRKPNAVESLYVQ